MQLIQKAFSKHLPRPTTHSLASSCNTSMKVPPPSSPYYPPFIISKYLLPPMSCSPSPLCLSSPTLFPPSPALPSPPLPPHCQTTQLTAPHATYASVPQPLCNTVTKKEFKPLRPSERSYQGCITSHPTASSTDTEIRRYPY